MTAAATAYRVVTGRNRDELRALLGPAYERILTSDRHAIYDHVPDDRHQYCWAHMRRDFRAMIDRKDAGSAAGEELLALSGKMFGWWRRVPDGTRTAVRFAGKMHAGRDFRVAFRAALARGAACGCAKTAGTCRDLLGREASLFLFAFVGGVEPTNNAAERAVAPRRHLAEAERRAAEHGRRGLPQARSGA